jgi:hypothetical protein
MVRNLFGHVGSVPQYRERKLRPVFSNKNMPTMVINISVDNSVWWSRSGISTVVVVVVVPS